MLDHLTDWVIDAMETLGYLGFMIILIIERVFPPIPSELVLPLAGFLASQDRFSFITLMLVGAVGATAGSYILYGLGRCLGERRARRLIQRVGGWLLLKEEDFDRSQAWFDRYGGSAVLTGQCVPGVRSLVAVPAGITRMPLLRFGLYTAAGSSVWNGALIGLGWTLGSQWHLVQDYTEILQYVVLAAIVAAIAIFLLRRLRERASSRPRADLS